MASEFRRSFKQKAKEAFGLPFRFRMGLEKLDSGGGGGGTEEFAPRSASFDLGYFTSINHDGETEVAKVEQSSLGDDFVMISDQDRESRKKPRTFVQPKGTISYTVSSTDTLPSIAAQFQTTTSELKKLNRMMSEMVCPGKIIFIPDKSYIPSESSSPSPPPCEEEEEEEEKEEGEGKALEEGGGGGQGNTTVAVADSDDLEARMGTGSAIPSSLRMTDPVHSIRRFLWGGQDLLLMGVKPILSVARQTASSASSTGTVGDAAKQTDEDWHEQFIKLHVNHIIDTKDDVVGGVLLVTPNAVMFESNAEDELVMKNGRGPYDVIVPMSVIVGVTICHEHAPGVKAPVLLKDASSFEDDVFDMKSETGSSSASKASKKTLATDGSSAVQKDCAAENLDSGKEVKIPPSIGDAGAGGGSTGGGSGDDCTSTDLLPVNSDKDRVKGQGLTTEVEGNELFSQKEEHLRLTLPNPSLPPATDVRSCATDDVLASGETVLQPVPPEVPEVPETPEVPEVPKVAEVPKVPEIPEVPKIPEVPCQKLESFTESSHPPSIDATSATADIIGDRRSGKDETITDEIKQTKPPMNNKEALSVAESSSGLETTMPPVPSKQRCSNLVSNIFRFQSSSSSASEASGHQTPPEKEGDVVEPGKEPEAGGGSTPTHRLMTRTLESLSSYSRPLVDLSSSLFSRSGSDSKSPKREDEQRSEFEGFKDKDKDKDQSSSAAAAAAATVVVEPVQAAAPHQRFFFLRPFDMLTKRSRGSSSTELTTEEVEASATEPEMRTSSVSGGGVGPEAEPPSTILYMCLKIGQFPDWSEMKQSPVASYIRMKLKPEYWFTIPSNRVDHLYAFFLQWSPNISGGGASSALDEINLLEKGFVLISHSTDGGSGLLDDEFNKLNSLSTSTGTAGSASKEWEIINAKEVRRMINVAEIESLPLPDLSDVSKIMNSTHVRELCFHLPPRAEGCPWQLVYSTDKHGFSLKTLYRRMARIESPVLLIIKDDSNNVFGAMLPCALKMSESFYGSGESYLFSFHPAFTKYCWTGQNHYFIKGNAESVSIGAGEGVYGLWLDGDLYHGRTQPCLTYDNDLLTVAEDFMIQCLEVWKFA